MEVIMLDSAVSDRTASIALAGLSPRALMLADIDRAVHATAQPDPARIAAALAPYLTDPDLLRGVACPCGAARYTRHLLGEGDGYCVLAITWRPGQMSPVHAHKAWCALGVHRGWLVESFFDTTGGTARPTGCLPRGIGATSHAAADGAAIHRIANVGVADALSIHVYGASYDRLGADVNLVLAD
jgi:predicted metal-dependent enzyme (double-stranded beta helix superfamily)